jgi:hypothetical protein
MKKALALALGIVFVLGMAGCDLFNPGNKSTYFPLTEGNKWEYEGTSTVSIDYPEGEFMPADTSWTINSTSVTEVIGKTTLTGADALEVWEVKSTTITDNPVDTTEGTSYVRIDKDTVYTYLYLDSAAVSSYPAEPVKDDTWKQGTITYTVVADNETAKTYTGCLKVEMKPDDTSMFTTYEAFQYWAKKTGVVMTTMKMVTEIPMGDGTMVTTTESESNLKTFTGK